MKIILLGDGCSISWLCQGLKISHATGLFEWCRSDYFKDIIYVLENINNVQVSNYKLPGNVSFSNTDIFSSHYRLNTFIEKVKRRSLRLIEDIKSSDNILFMRRDYYNTGITEEQFNTFKTIISSINENCKYTFLLLSTKENIINDPTFINKIIDVNSVEENSVVKKQEDLEVWKRVFIEIGCEDLLN